MADSTSCEPYKLPQTGLLSYLPASWVPYAELMRLDRPGGFYALWMPCLFGIAYATASAPAPEQLSPALLADRALTTLLCCLLARGAACTWNDNIDKEFDRKVARCRNRPLARGAVTPLQAHIWASIQTVTILLILLLHMPPECTTYFLGIVVLSALYPFAKRFTFYPQLLLGSILSVGFLTSVRSVNVDPLANDIVVPSLCFFVANTLWTMIYDTIYAHQDVADDIHAGVKSMAVHFRASTKRLAACLGVAMTVLLAMTGVYTGLGPLYFVPAVGGSALSLAATIARVDLADPRSCAWWFNGGFVFVGGCIICGFAAEYLGGNTLIHGEL